MNWTKPGIIDFNKVGDEETGFLSMAQQNNPLPFQLKRTYWIYGNKVGQQKGNQATIKTKQALIVLQGMVEVELEDREGNVSKYTVYNPAQGLYIPELHWRKVKIIEPSIVVVLCSELYTEKDYIRDFKEFKNFSI